MKGICVAGIDTEVGKTFVSMLLVEALDYNYWKPVQTGYPEHSDSRFVEEHCTCSPKIFPEQYKYKDPVSPHQAGPIDLKQINLPDSAKGIVVETAGGIMSPLTLAETNLDMMIKLKLPVVLVVKNYLGSINHSLMSIRLIQEHLPLLGLIISGEANPHSEEAYEALGAPILHRIPFIEKLNIQKVQTEAGKLREALKNKL